MSKRVVITGLGAITPIGIGKEAFWEALKAGKNGIGRITHFDPTEYTAQVAGEVNDFVPEDYIDKKESKRMDRYTQFAVAAAGLAIKDAALDLEKEDAERIGVFVGTGIGGIETMHSQYEKFFAKGPSRISPFFIPMMIPNLAAGQVSIAYRLHGPSSCIVTACATGSDCIGEAFREIQRGGADVMLAGGTEAAVSQAAVAGFAAMKALCTDHNDDPAHASRPFDKNRSGFVMGEGSGIVVLETLEHAKERGAHIYAEVVGYGANSDAYHMTSPAPHGEYQSKCMERALKDAGLKPDEVDYINAHGTSTHLNDQGETEAIKRVWGEAAKDVSVSSIKSMTGHLLGAAGGVECIATALSIENDFLPPTINYETPDEGMDLDYVPNKGKAKKVRAAMSNSFGFGGHNACLVLKKFAD
ncbi:MAG: beta-ketoacyl-ACP synthase II [Selenomonadaceae bacterium]|nr:beta-ketoacyl-ACP synthase II [Selenomonadaceae bacterium]